MSCGSVWTCPHCASRICNKRKAELDKVLSWAREQGHSMYHVTYTLPEGSLNPFEILNSSDPEMIKLGREYIKDMEGQRAIVMSQGLKIMSVVDHMDDMDLLKSEVENVEEWDVYTPHSVWQHIKLNKQLALYEEEQ